MDSLLLYFLALIIPAIASININNTFKKYKIVSNKKGKTGYDVAREILDKNGLNNLYIVEVRGELTDHYDPKQKVVRLSTDIYHGESVAALAVAAHECGHAIQDKENYTFFRIRSMICPVINFITYGAYILFVLSIIFEMVDALSLAIGMVFFSLIFQLVTLPVEFDASKRALGQIKECGLVENGEDKDADAVLKAAALTYVAAVLSSILDLVRLLIISNRRRD